jgi:hypothetical protein
VCTQAAHPLQLEALRRLVLVRRDAGLNPALPHHAVLLLRLELGLPHATEVSDDAATQSRRRNEQARACHT